jgi:hypothetical protein
MSTDASTDFRHSQRAYKAIFLAGLVAGILDLTAALGTGWFMRGTKPVRILQAIASGILGARSYSLGYKSAALGVASHFLIALGAATVFYAASRKFKFLVNHAVICGLIYGIVVFFFMSLVVLRLSAITFKQSYDLQPLLTGLIVHMLCVGLPISLIVRRYSR